MTTEHLTVPKAIIFDWDNTLIDSWVVIHDALNATFREFGVTEWTLDETRSRVAKSMRESFPAIFGERWEDAGKAFYGHFEAIHLDRLTPFPDAEDVIKDLKGLGLYLGVVSNKTGTLLRAEAEQLGWSGYFGQIVGATDAAKDKPAIDPVLMALDGSGLELGADVWFVGDAPIDMECGHNAGCTPILIHDEPPAKALFNGAQPALHLDALQKLSNLAKKL